MKLGRARCISVVACVAAASLVGCQDSTPQGESTSVTPSGEADSLVQGMLDQDLVLLDGFYEATKDKPFTLNSDGTVTGDADTLVLLSKATHWRFQDGTLDLCTSESCEFWSAWTVTAGDPSSQVTGNVYVLTLKGATDEEGEPVTRTVAAPD